MFQTAWDVLLVDDEPDVLSVSKLAMKNFTVYGLPLRLHTAQSKAEAIELLKTTLGGPLPGTSPVEVAFIDVVMETDTAGLELCEYMRETMKLRHTQIFVRTGQPGVAPERAVMDRYDISGYFTKVEATEDKLYTLVKAGVRQSQSIARSRMAAMLLHAMITVSDSRDKMLQVFRQVLAASQTDATGKPLPNLAINTQIIIDDKVVAQSGGVGEREALAQRDRLDRLAGTPLDEQGGKYVVDGNHVLIKVAGGPSSAAVSLLAKSVFSPPEFVISSLYGFLKSFAVLWHRAT
jgi:CheY-like chemotaxis protein